MSRVEEWIEYFVRSDMVNLKRATTAARTNDELIRLHVPCRYREAATLR